MPNAMRWWEMEQGEYMVKQGGYGGQGGDGGGGWDQGGIQGSKWGNGCGEGNEVHGKFQTLILWTLTFVFFDS